MCLFSEIRLLSSCSLTCCLLLIIILFLYLPLQKHARLLLLHGNHLLVSLSCSAASLIHNISPPLPAPRQHQDGCSSINKQSASSFSPSPHSLPSAAHLAFLKMTPPKCDRNTTSLAGGGGGNAASHRSWPVNAAAKVFLVQRSIILRAWFDDAFLIGAVRCWSN